MKKRKLLVLCLALLMVGGGTLTSCGGSNRPTSTVSLTIDEFNVDESKIDNANVQEYYQVKAVSAKDSNGKYYICAISVKDPDGQDVEVTDNRFLCAKMGDYKVTYTATLDDGQTASKTYTVRVIDVGDPVISSKLRSKKDASASTTDFHNITQLGTTYDLKDITVTDNSGEAITPTIKVAFNGEELNLEGDTVTFDQKGAYSINVTATDSSDNMRDETYYVYTLMDFEHGAYYNNEWYASEISEDVAYNGTHSYEFGMYDKATQWFNDYSMLGDVYLYETTDKYVSFWMYFDLKTNNINGAMMFNAVYHSMKVFDSKGVEVERNWQNKIGLSGNKWYRFLVNMQEMEMSGETNDKADAAPVKASLREIPFFVCPWDYDLGANADKKTFVYLDDIRLVGDVDDEDYKKPQYEYEPSKVTTQVSFNSIFAQQLESAALENSYGKATFFHGTLNDRKAFKKINDNPYQLGIEEGQNVEASNTFAEGWRFFYGASGGFGYQFEAKEHCFVRIVEQKNDDTIKTAGWPEGKKTYATLSAKDDLDVLYDEWLSGKGGDLGTDYIELEKGDSFLYMLYHSANRNIQYPPYIEVAGVKIKGTKEYKPSDTVTNVDYQADLFSKQLDSTTGWVENDLAKMTIAHGTYQSYEPMKNITAEGSTEYTLGSEGDNKASVLGWKAISGYNDGVVYAIEAKQHIFAKIVEKENIGGWITESANTNIEYAVYHAATGETELISSSKGVKGNFGCDFVELQEGDRLIFVFRFEWSDYRNYEQPSNIALATAVEL